MGNRASFWTSKEGKGEDLDCGSSHGLKLIDQVMKQLEHVLDFYVHEIVYIYVMQFSFVSARNTTDAISIARQLQEKYFAADKLLQLFFVNLAQAFFPVPTKTLESASRSLNVEE